MGLGNFMIYIPCGLIINNSSPYFIESLDVDSGDRKTFDIICRRPIICMMLNVHYYQGSVGLHLKQYNLRVVFAQVELLQGLCLNKRFVRLFEEWACLIDDDKNPNGFTDLKHRMKLIEGRHQQC